MDWGKLRETMAAFHAKEPQRAMKAEMALKAAEAACKELESLGHSFGLVEESDVVPKEFPKMLYKSGEVPMIANSKEEVPPKSAGWSEKPVL